MKSFISTIPRVGLLLLLIISINLVKAQNFQYTIDNQAQVTAKIVEFDLLLLNLDPANPIEIATVQAGIIVNSATYGGGIVTAAIIAGSSTMNSYQVPTSVAFTQTANIVKLAAKAPPGCGAGTIMSTNPEIPTRLCRLRLTNSMPWNFTQQCLNPTFCFTTTPYQVKLSQYSSECVNTAIALNPGNSYTIGSICPIWRNLSIKFFLEGLYEGSENMHPASNENGPQYASDTADILTVKLASQVYPYQIVNSNDSVPVSSSGICKTKVLALSQTSYYIVVSHRNSVETWSKYPVVFNSSTDTVFYDFTTEYEAAYNNNLKAIADQYVIFGGDVNQDGVDDSGDMINTENLTSLFAIGYLPEDANGDGVIDATDMILIENNSNDFVASYSPGSSTAEVLTLGIDGITYASANCHVDIAAQGSFVVTSRGSCWSTSPSPVISDPHTNDGAGAGNFTSAISGLMPMTTYYARGYATNLAGTYYGNLMSFTTLMNSPTVVTESITSISMTTANGGGSIISDGGGVITSKGVCWSLVSNPTILDNHTDEGTGTSAFTSTLIDLIPGTEYHLRAYATNLTGTSYGDEFVFTTLPVLAVVSTEPITAVTSSTASCGGNISQSGGTPVIARGVCWNTLPNPTILNLHTDDGTGVGLFTSNLTGLLPNTEYYIRAFATNDSGTAYGYELLFTTLPNFANINTNSITEITANSATGGGIITDDGGSPILQRGICWSNQILPTIQDDTTCDGIGSGTFISFITGLTPNMVYHVRAYAINAAGTAYGDTVSFVTPFALPVIETTEPVEITGNTASSGGNIINDGGSLVISRGVCWSLSPNPTISDSVTLNGTGSGGFASTIAGLTTNTTYYLRAYATNSQGTAYGNEFSFTTLLYITGTPVTDIDNNEYSTIILNNQQWIGENLRTTRFTNGDLIPEVTGSSEWSGLGTAAWCWYNNNESNDAVYGKLYNWFTVSDPRNVCPSGWHVPTDSDWTTLIEYLGGSASAGGKMKETGLTHWNSPNTGATDASALTGLPGGSRNTTGTFISIGTYGIWWSSTESTSVNSWYRSLYYNNASATRTSNSKKYGFSIRCVKDL